MILICIPTRRVAIADLLRLRKLKAAQKKEGINAERLNAGEAKKRKKAKKEGDGYGLRDLKADRDRVRDGDDEE
jgi:hypothetical protein